MQNERTEGSFLELNSLFCSGRYALIGHEKYHNLWTTAEVGMPYDQQEEWRINKSLYESRIAVVYVDKLPTFITTCSNNVTAT